MKIGAAALLCLASIGHACMAAEARKPVDMTPWEQSYNLETGERFIPVELFTGVEWDGTHELVMKEATTTACASSNGRWCDNYHITGPFKTEKNDTKIDWVGNQIPYYIRTFENRHMGPVESHFTINASKDGLVRIFDKRKQWGERRYTGVGIKFPLGYWKQGEVRTYPTRRPIRLEILEIDGPDHCLKFRWTIGDGKRRNTDNNYTFCPGVGFKAIDHNYAEPRKGE